MNGNPEWIRVTLMVTLLLELVSGHRELGNESERPLLCCLCNGLRHRKWICVWLISIINHCCAIDPATTSDRQTFYDGKFSWHNCRITVQSPMGNQRKSPSFTATAEPVCFLVSLSYFLCYIVSKNLPFSVPNNLSPLIPYKPVFHRTFGHVTIRCFLLSSTQLQHYLVHTLMLYPRNSVQSLFIIAERQSVGNKIKYRNAIAWNTVVEEWILLSGYWERSNV